MEDAKKTNSPKIVFSKWKKICDHDMRECEKDFLRKDSFILRQFLKNSVLLKILQIFACNGHNKLTTYFLLMTLFYRNKQFVAISEIELIFHTYCPINTQLDQSLM